jgi:hypothetical protein
MKIGQTERQKKTIRRDKGRLKHISSFSRDSGGHFHMFSIQAIPGKERYLRSWEPYKKFKNNSKQTRWVLVFSQVE